MRVSLWFNPCNYRLSLHGAVVVSMLPLRRFFPFDEAGVPFAETTLVVQESHNHSSAGGEDGGTGLNVWDGALLL